MGKSRLGKTALGFSTVAFFSILLSFSTSSWLVSDGKIEDPKFDSLGLWVVCLKNFEDVRHWYDTKFTGCEWVYLEELYIIHEFLLPGFFIAVQFFFTLCFILMLIAGFLTLIYLCTSKHDDSFVGILCFLGGTLFVAGICGTFACIIFGTYGDARFWMPHWEHNNMGYSFWFACIGTVSSYISALCFLVESRKYRVKRDYLYNRE